MERKDRPLGREKTVVSGSAHVGRREGGPVSGGPVGHGGSRSGGGKRNSPSGQPVRSGGGSPLIKLIAVAAAVLFGGGGVLGTILGGGDTSTTAPPSITQPATSSQVITPQSSAGGSSRQLDTTVSPDARAKRVSLKGDGSDTTTILVYMCGTDLESDGGFASKDLQEMCSASLSNQINLLVWTGGCKSWKDRSISSSRNQIFQIKNGRMALLHETKQLSPMTDPNTLSTFIRWGKENFPANRYELIFWDHGGGSLSGYGYDEVYPKSGSMTLDRIYTALRDGGVTFDFVGFDACLMATLETALVTEPFADYLIASEETEPGCGWYYTGWLDALSKNPSLPALEIARTIADDFVSTCGRVSPRQQATLSVIDLAEFRGTVPARFSAFAEATDLAVQSDDYQSIAVARGKTKEFSASSKLDQIDLIDLANNMNTPESRALAAALDGAVKYNATSRNIQNANGLSICFPYGKTSNVNKMANLYAKIDMDEAYTDCIRSFASLEVAGQTLSGGQDGQLSSLFGALTSGGSAYPSTGTNSADVVMNLLGMLLANSGRSLPNVGLGEGESDFLDADLLNSSSAYLTSHQFDSSALVWTEKNGQKVLALSEEQWALVQDVELNVFADDGQGYVDLGLDNTISFTEDGDLLGDYDRTWLSVNGQIVAYYMLSSEGTPDSYKIMGYIPAQLNGRRVELIVCFTDETPEGEILGASPLYDAETETSTISRGLLEIQQGDVIDFLCDCYAYDRTYQDSYYLGNSLTVDGPLTLGNIRMDNGEYIASYRITDIYNNHYWTPSV